MSADSNLQLDSSGGLAEGCESSVEQLLRRFGYTRSNIEAMPASELNQLLVRLDNERSAAMTLETLLLGEAAVRKTTRCTQHRSPAILVGSTNRTKIHGAGGLTAMERDGTSFLKHLPLIRQALWDGLIAVDSARHIGFLADQPCTRDQAIADQERFLKWLIDDQMQCGEFTRLLGHWKSFHDHSEPTLEDDFAARRWTRTSLGGMELLELDIPREQWVQVEAALLPRVERMFQDDWELCRVEHGDDAEPSLMRRTNAQRWLDAFVELARTATGDDSLSKAVVHAVIDADTLLHEAEKAAHRASGSTGPEPERTVTEQTIRSYRSETETGVQLSPEAIFRMMVLNQLRVHVNSERTGKIKTSSANRVYTGELRRALLIRSPRCQTPGCETVAHRCEVDHHHPVERGGLTTDENARVKCKPCHRHKTMLEALGYCIDDLE